MWNPLDRPVDAHHLARVTARDGVLTAERAVASCEAALAEREADVVALDGIWSHAWLTLTGGKDAAVEAALRRVAEARRRLDTARGKLAEARAVAEGVASADAERAEADRADAERHADEVAAILTRDDLVAGELRALQLERDLLRERFAAVEEAALAGSDLLGTLTTITRGTDTIRETTDTQDTWRTRAWGGEFRRTGAYSYIQSAVAEAPGKVARFKAALAALGQTLADRPLRTDTVSPMTSLLRNGMAELDLLAQAEDLAEDYADFAAEIRQFLPAIDAELRQLRQALPELDQRERHLVGWAVGRLTAPPPGLEALAAANPAGPETAASRGTSGDRS